MKKLLAAEAGHLSTAQATVETALIVPLLLAVFLGTFTLAWTAFAAAGLHEAASQAGLAAQRADSINQAQAAAEEAFSSDLVAYPLRNEQISLGFPLGFARGGPANVTASAQVVWPWLGEASPLRLTATFTTVIEPYRSR